MLDLHHPRIEEAFQKYFYRAPYDDEEGPEDDADADGRKQEKCLHEFEIIIGHANVIRYFLCR
jgi:serine/threonine-protein phosphatase PGAM5